MKRKVTVTATYHTDVEIVVPSQHTDADLEKAVKRMGVMPDEINYPKWQEDEFEVIVNEITYR